MAKKRLVFSFPTSLLDQPITYQLVKRYDLMVNILRARVTPREEGELVVEVSGDKKSLEEGLRFIEEAGVGIKPLAQRIIRHENLCIECTACTSACPTGALLVERPDMRLVFDGEKCIACELCVPTCAYKVMEMVF